MGISLPVPDTLAPEIYSIAFSVFREKPSESPPKQYRGRIVPMF